MCILKMMLNKSEEIIKQKLKKPKTKFIHVYTESD